MNAKIESETASIVAEKIDCSANEVDQSCVAHVLETQGASVFDDDLVAQIMTNQEDGRIESIYRVGRRYYLRFHQHGHIESADWRPLPASTALIWIEEWMDGDEEDEQHPELDARPDDPDSIEDLLLPLDA